MAKTILVVDDKEELRVLLKSYLEQEGFHVVTAVNGRDALFLARQEKPDLIILDLMMPEMGGYDFMRTHSREADTPTIILTAKLEENDKILGLELGADDYVTKPFSMRELTARVRAVLRRANKDESEQDILRAADIMLDRNGRLVTVNEVTIDLTPSEFDLLARTRFLPSRPAGQAARRCFRRVRTHHRRPYPQFTRQNRAGLQKSALCGNRLRLWLPLCHRQLTLCRNTIRRLRRLHRLKP